MSIIRSITVQNIDYASGKCFVYIRSIEEQVVIRNILTYTVASISGC